MAQKTARHMAIPIRVERRRRPVALVAVLVVTLVVAAVGWALWHNRPSAEGPAQDAGQEETKDVEQEEAPAGEEPQDATPQDDSLAAQFAAGTVGSVRLVGDSITAGFGTDGYVDANLTQTGNVIFDNGAGLVRYETSAEAQCWANAFRTYATEHGVQEFINAGINGAFMKELAQNPDAWLGDGADVIVVALGTNDAGYETVEEYEEAARTALAAAEQTCKVLVVVSPVCDLRPADWLMASPKELGDVLRAICEERGYLFVDAYDAVAPEQFCDDGLHPATPGSLAIWDCIRTTLGL